MLYTLLLRIETTNYYHLSDDTTRYSYKDSMLHDHNIVQYDSCEKIVTVDEFGVIACRKNNAMHEKK